MKYNLFTDKNYSSSNNNDIAIKKSLIEKKLEESGEKAKLEEFLR